MADLTFLELALLGNLHRKPGSGYDLRKEFVSNPVGRSTGSPGAVYPALRKLKKLGLISGSVRNPGTLRPKEIFTLTARGKSALRKNILQPITRPDVIWRLDIIMLRFTFAEEVTGLKGCRRIARALATELRGVAAEMQQFHRDVGPRISFTAGLALENAVQSFRQQGDWASRVVRKLDRKLKGV